MGRGTWLLAALGWMSVSAASGGAAAQDAPLEAARELYAEARVEPAAEVLREGLQAGTIGEGRVLEALELLALVERARADEAALEEALRWLMLADREGEALRSSPPSLRARYDALWEAEGAALPEVEAEGGAAGWTLRAEGAPLPPGVALVLRGETDEGWEEGPPPLQLPAAPRLRYGFVLRLGQTDLYRSALARAEAAPAQALAVAPGEEDEDEGGAPLGWILGGVGAAVVAAVVVGVVLATRSDDGALLVGPTEAP